MRLSAMLLMVLLCTAALADDYTEARAGLVAAHEAGDYPAMRDAAEAALAARPEFPAALFNKALAEVLDGDNDAAMGTLGRLVGKQIDYGIENIEAFAPLEKHPVWQSFLANVESLRAEVGDAVIAASSERSDFIPEGIAVRNADDIILGGVRHGQILFMRRDLPEMAVGPFGHWSVFGMRFDGAGGLWFASSRVPQYVGKSDRSAFMAGLYRLDLETVEIDHRARLPAAGGAQVLGDLVIDGDAIYTTDSIGGPVYRYSIAANEYSTMVPRGVLGSPQGLALGESGDYLYVADYIGGLYRIRLDDGAVEKLSVPATASDYGIDGLYRHGNRLIAIQNGIRPHRVTAFSLSDDGLTVESAEILAMNLPEFDEPTLGAVVGDDFYFVANSHWNRFDADNELPDGLTGPIVLRLSLRSR